MSHANNEKQGADSQASVSKNPLEWAVFAVSLLLVLGVLGYLGREIFLFDKAPPHIVLQLGKPQQLQKAAGEEAGFIVSVQASNKGRQTAEGVHIEVEMQRGSEKPEAADFEIAFLPRGSSREGWVAFKGTKENVKLKARVLGYEIP